MPSPKPKQVSDDSMARIRAAIQTLNDEPTTPRTKRELQRRTGLSHDLVARAFRQDDEYPERWQLRRLFDALSDGPSRRRTPEQAKTDKLQALLEHRNAENAAMRQQLDGAASVIVALELQLGAMGNEKVVAISSRRPGWR
ncbi:hypothetical protein [Kribbella speibonae]|uniref:Uncharacterized protein n=1 Tax=Kribbella speibonae TaxID=1572660 RepID=A0A4R0IS40_9ACTN|nr:hypothetical protein [Kribbella speibonae]TCC35877.1 hypothetical protein E0H92_24575 [Kribbella speibonae]